MIDRLTIEKIINEYKQELRLQDKQPTYESLAEALNISDVTVSHIVKGFYKFNKPYTNKPHCTRCIDNNDFDLITELFI